jgi:hypothetical protein
VSEFVEECRREWRRLGVPDPVANEMAADLTADLEEAAAEGATAEDVLGNSAFDPRRFAGAWAVARGVTAPPTPDRRTLWRPPVVIGLGVLLGVLCVLTVGAGLVLAVGRSSRSVVAASRVLPSPGPFRLFAPGGGRGIGPFVGTQITDVNLHPLALVLLMVGVAGLGLLTILYLSPWFGPRRYRRHEGRWTSRWN